MEPTPSSPLPKRARAKLKIVKDSTQTQSAVAKKPRAPRKTPTKPAPEASLMPEAEVVAATPDPSPEDVGTMIATAAYYLAAARNFSPGHELDDWLEAERAIHAKLFG